MSADRALQSSPPLPQESDRHADSLGQVPDVCFIEDVCRALKISRSTVERLRRHGAFPIPEMLALDARPRWSGTKVRAFREREQVRHGRQSRPQLIRGQR